MEQKSYFEPLFSKLEFLNLSNFQTLILVASTVLVSHASAV